jgi:uncharacterized protein (TIGR03435 family)
MIQQQWGRSPTCREQAEGLLHMICIVLTAATAFGQTPAPAFEVASIRPHAASVDAPVLKNPDVNPIRISGSRVDLKMIGLKGLVMAAYNVREYQVSGGPGWASGPDGLYDIAAKTEGDTAQSMDQIRLMLRSLLTERFHLKLRHESKQLPVYNLVIAKGGPKLKAVAGDAPPAPGMRRGSMDQLAALLSLMVDRPVIDKTGLAGIYEYSSGLTLLDMGAQDSADVIARTLTTIQELGLKAQPSKAILEMLVIESAEKPSENTATAQEPPAAFEVASIRPYQGSAHRSGPLTVSSPLIRLEGYTVFGLVLDAYHLRDDQLVFGAVAHPDDVYNTRYDIIARAPGDSVPSIGDARAMLQNLLADRFKLRAHREAKEMPVYALVVGKNGPRLKASSASGPCSVHTALASDGRNSEATFANCSVGRLADDWLSNLFVDRPVLDQTGLIGNYDFRLVAIPESRSLGRSDPADIPPNFAIGELGLKLIAQKALIDILAVDHVEKPDEN